MISTRSGWLYLKYLKLSDHPSRKIAVRLKIYDVDNFLLAIKIIVLSNLFERDISGIVSEINQNLELKKILDVDFPVNAQYIYKFIFDLSYESVYSFLADYSKLNAAKELSDKKQ